MGQHHLRADKECQNCGNIVEHRYCSRCGQENTETRQSFAHLVRHFFEDLTHYDSGFWKTIKYLLFRPGRLTKEFLAGRRMSYVPPVRLYIFISFLCFFLPAVLPTLRDYQAEKKITVERAGDVETEIGIEQPVDTGVVPGKLFRTDVLWSGLNTNENGRFEFQKPNDYVSVAQMDSMQALLPEAERYDDLERWMVKRTIELYHHNTPEDIARKFGESFVHNLPKVLFIYMPLFAFLLWLFQKKKKWLYFDHAIFTLHYFSFMLLTISIFLVLRCLLHVLPYSFYSPVNFYSFSFILLWMFYYFFRAHYKMYGERRRVSILKGLMLFFINFIAILVLLVIIGYYTLLTLH